jgi:hypothetical protein
MKSSSDSLLGWYEVRVSTYSSTVAKNLLPVCSNLCEIEFSRYAATKAKYRCRLNAEHNIRIVFYTVPDLKALCIR